jgi:hypothetical protein
MISFLRVSIKIQNPGGQGCLEGFNSGIKGLILSLHLELLGQAVSFLVQPPSPTMTKIISILPVTEPPLVCGGCG